VYLVPNRIEHEICCSFPLDGRSKFRLDYCNELLHASLTAFIHRRCRSVIVYPDTQLQRPVRRYRRLASVNVNDIAGSVFRAQSTVLPEPPSQQHDGVLLQRARPGGRHDRISGTIRVRTSHVVRCSRGHAATKETSVVRAGADLRTGASVQTAALPVGAGTRTSRRRHRTDADPGQDMVSEPSLQDEEGGQGQDARRDVLVVVIVNQLFDGRRRFGQSSPASATPSASAVAEEGRRSTDRQRRQEMSVDIDCRGTSHHRQRCVGAGLA